jgi:uncharacterized C2H2 Zn-finger protein
VHRSAKVGMPCVGHKRYIAPSKDTPQVCVSGNLHLLKEIPRKTKRHGDLEYIMAKKHADPPHYTFSFKPDTTNQLRLPNRAIDLAEFFPTAESLMQLQPDERRKLVAAVLAKPPRKWNRHDFLSKLIVQQIVSKELGKHSVRAILKNETVRSDLMLTYHSKQEHKPPRDQRQRKRPFDRQCERPSTPFQFALGLRRAATEPEDTLPPLSSVAVVELKYSNVTSHGKSHWRHGLRINRKRGPPLEDAHFIIAILDPKKCLSPSLDYTNLNSIKDHIFLFSCSGVGFLSDVSVAVNEAGKLPSAEYLARRGFVAFKINPNALQEDKEDGAPFLVDAFQEEKQFCLARALVYCQQVCNLDDPRPTLFQREYVECPRCGTVLSCAERLTQHLSKCSNYNYIEPGPQTKRQKVKSHE